MISFLLAPRSSSDPPPSGVSVSMVLTHYQGFRLQSQHGREVGELHRPSSSLHVKRPIYLFHHYYTAFDEEDEDWRRRDEMPGKHDYRFHVFKTDIMEHLLYEQLVSTHVSCLRIATSVDQLSRIDKQLVQSQSVVDKYSGADKDVGVMDEKDLDLLHSIKEQLQQHVRVQGMECNGCAVVMQLLCLGGKDLVELVDVGHEVGAGETLAKDCRDVGGADNVATAAGDPFLHDGRQCNRCAVAVVSSCARWLCSIHSAWVFTHEPSLQRAS
ncbi:hypothetical protein ACFX2I_022156 [Malus domestica]